MLKNTLLPVQEFVERRNRLAEQLPENSLVFIRSGEEVTRSNDTEYHFCPNRNFYYLTGFKEPDAVLVIVKTDTVQNVLFCREKDELQEVWHGRRVGPDAAVSTYGVELAFNNDQIEEKIVDYLSQVNNVFYCFNDNDSALLIPGYIAQVASQVKLGKKAPKNLCDCADLIHELRLHKSSRELDIMRRANVISGNAHQRAMKATCAGKFEYQIEAELLHEFANNGARFAAYNSIVAGGDNANILHYTDNDEQLNDGELLLIDAGCELAEYAADITRTFPISGTFTDEQKRIYQLVLDSQIAAIEAIKPEQTLATLNDIVCEVLTKGLLELGILKGELAELIEQKACKRFFIHGLGHWLGLDVHDVGDYQINDKRLQLRPFAPGMVMTIEPGIYIPLGADVDKKWQGIGVRIEDNIAVTETGYENLTVNAPKEIEEIEALMAAS